MEEHPTNLKRKRETDYPRVTFDTGTRTFDRLLKESTLDELKDGVRRKLGYAPNVPLQLTQLRDSKSVDLEDEDDFEAFCFTAHSLSVITVHVSAPPDAPRATPAELTPAPPPSRLSPESPKKRKKRRKQEEGDAKEPAQKRKRKGAVSDGEDESMEEPPLPEKKRRKKKVASEVSEVIPANPQLTKDANANGLATKATVSAKVTPVGEEVQPGGTSKGLKSKKEKAQPRSAVELAVEGASEATGEGSEPKKRKKERRKKDSATDRTPAMPAPEGADDDQDQGGDAAETVDEILKTAKGKDTGKAKERAPLPVGGTDARKKKTNAKVPKPPAQASNANAPLPPVNGKEHPISDSDFGVEEIPAKDIQVPAPSVNGSSTSGKVTGLPSKNEKKLASDRSGDSQAPEEGAAGGNGKSKSKRAKTPAAILKEAPAYLDKIVAQKVAKKAVETKDPKPNEKTKAAETVSKPNSDLCSICGRNYHVRSRCTIVRGSIINNRRMLQAIKKELEEAPDDFKSRQIKEIEAIIQQKTGETEETNKVVSNKPNVVTDIAAKTVTSVAQDKTKSTEKPTTSQTAKNKSSVSSPLEETLSTAQSPPNYASSSKSARTSTHKNYLSDSSSEEESLANRNATKTNRVLSRHKNQSPKQRSESDNSDEHPSDSILDELKSFVQGRRPFDISHTASQGLASAINRAHRSNHSSEEEHPITPSTSKIKAIFLEKSSDSDSSGEEEVPTTKASPTQTPAKFANNGYKEVQADDNSSDNHSGEEALQTVPPPPGPTIPPLSYADMDLDAVIRGPNISLTTKDLPSSDSSEDEEADKETEELAEEDEEQPRHKTSQKMAAADRSSDEEQSDGPEQDPNQSIAAPRRPPRLSIAVDRQTDTSAPSTTVEHGNLTFGDVDDLASSVEIDPQGDRAFSEALADDTAVFHLAADPDSSHGSDGRATPEHIATKPNPPTPNGRRDSIERFESPEKPTLSSPIVDRDVVRPTPQGLAHRMKTRAGKTPVPPSSSDKAYRLLDSVRKAKAGEGSNQLMKYSSQPAPPSTDNGKAKATPGQSNYTTRSKSQPLSPQANKKTMSRAVPIPPPSSKKPPSTKTIPGPSSQPLPPRVTRSRTKAHGGTQESEHVWQVLHADDSSQNEGEGINMEDELQSDVEALLDNPLFIPSETQNSFPYSQWQGVEPAEESPRDSDEEDEVESTIIGKLAKKPVFGYTGLSHIASQRRSFRTSLLGGPPKAAEKKDAVVDLYGQTGDDDPSEESGSDSDSDADKMVEKSHIPKSRLAGASVRSKP